MRATHELSERDRLIVALDVASAAEAKRLVGTLGDAVSTFKVGKQLFTAAGPDIVREIVRGGHRVFLDLKFHDIPHTVEAAVRAASSLGVSLLTVHAPGGSRMLKAAVRASKEVENPPTILGVTVLTSMNEDDVAEVGMARRLADQVLHLAELALSCGCGGIVTSAREAAVVRRKLGQNFAIATPGIRPAGTAVEDQQRVVTPAEAIAAGVTYLVVGRPITAAADPLASARGVLREIEGAAASVGR